MHHFSFRLLVYLIVVFSFTAILTSCSTTKRVSNKSRYTTKSKKRNSRKSDVANYPKSRITNKVSRLPSKRMKIVQTAKSYIGIPYVYGGKSANGFDCSGFTAQVYNDNGIQIKGASHHQAVLGKKITKHQAKPGDLVSFKSKGKITHVAIITEVKADQIWVAHSTSSKGVINNEIWNSKYWRPKIYEFRDVIN